MKKLVLPVTMFLFGVIAFVAIMIIMWKMDLSFENDPRFWIYLMLTALAAISFKMKHMNEYSVNVKLKNNYVDLQF